jgi:histidine phosphotransfer protein HptB
VELRKLFDQTVELFEKATNPLVSRTPAPGGFGRKVSNQGFGRI